MLGYEVQVNGSSVHRVVVDPLKVCVTRVSWLNQPKADGSGKQFSMGTGGVNGDGDSVKWGSEQTLKVGDVVTIRILDLEEGDEPEVSQSLSNEVTSEITKMIEKIKDINPLKFGL